MLKYHVAVCDDEKSDLDGIVQSVQQYDVQGCFDIETYMDGNELLSELQMQKKSFDLLLLDIEMPSNGFQLAQSLIQMEKHPLVVFVTKRHEYAVQGYVIIPNKSTAISVKKRFCAVLFPAKIYRPATHPIILPSVSPDKILRLYCVGGIFFLGKPYLENFMSRPSVIPAFRPTPLQNRGRNFVRSKRQSTYMSSGTLYLFLRLNNSETTFGNAF